MFGLGRGETVRDYEPSLASAKTGGKVEPVSTTGCGAVGSAPRLGRGGRTFESCHPDQKK